jgi:bifunctional non-homologous end joining protein LigD
VQVHLANEAVKVFTRRGNDWTKRFRKIADHASKRPFGDNRRRSASCRERMALPISPCCKTS